MVAMRVVFVSVLVAALLVNGSDGESGERRTRSLENMMGRFLLQDNVVTRSVSEDGLLVSIENNPIIRADVARARNRILFEPTISNVGDTNVFSGVNGTEGGDARFEPFGGGGGFFGLLRDLFGL
ncbi:hypothetical protein BSKO_10446 [Bryopsis sp. KO-2023]|nr:hypothetical protein BSKO_10446 [Bryopsis sp. KO-2023]